MLPLKNGGTNLALDVKDQVNGIHDLLEDYSPKSIASGFHSRKRSGNSKLFSDRKHYEVA